MTLLATSLTPASRLRATTDYRGSASTVGLMTAEVHGLCLDPAYTSAPWSERPTPPSPPGCPRHAKPRPHILRDGVGAKGRPLSAVVLLAQGGSGRIRRLFFSR